jgi:hypothetical protein
MNEGALRDAIPELAALFCKLTATPFVYPKYVAAL